jgi:hypothetical protein
MAPEPIRQAGCFHFRRIRRYGLAALTFKKEALRVFRTSLTTTTVIKLKTQPNAKQKLNLQHRFPQRRPRHNSSGRAQSRAPHRYLAGKLDVGTTGIPGAQLVCARQMELKLLRPAMRQPDAGPSPARAHFQTCTPPTAV